MIEGILNILNTSVLNQDYGFIYNIILGCFAIWLYNELRKNYINIKLQDKLEIEQALEHYSKLYYNIILYQQEQLSTIEFYNSFNNSIVFLPTRYVRMLLNLDISTSSLTYDELEDVKSEIFHQVICMKANQKKITTYDEKSELSSKIIYIISKYKVKEFLNPLIGTFILTFLILSIMLTFYKPQYYIKNLTLILVNFEIGFFICISLLDNNNLIKNRISRKILLYYILLVILPLAYSVYKFEIKYTIISSFTIVIFLSITFFSKKLKAKVKIKDKSKTKRTQT